MEINVGNYIIKSDKYNLWIEKKYTNKKGAESVTKVAGYARDFRELLDSFIKHQCRISDAKTAKKLLEDLKKAENDSLQIVDAYYQSKNNEQVR